MCRTCASSAGRAAAGGVAAPSGTESRACPARPGSSRSTHARPRAGSTVSSDEPSCAIEFGGRSATPCESTVRAKSTGSPPPPSSFTESRPGLCRGHAVIVRFSAEETLDGRSPRKSGTDVNHGGGYAGVKAHSGRGAGGRRIGRICDDGHERAGPRRRRPRQPWRASRRGAVQERACAQLADRSRDRRRQPRRRTVGAQPGRSTPALKRRSASRDSRPRDSDRPGRGYPGLVKTVTASLYCGGSVQGSTPSAPLSSRGDAELDGSVTVPAKCLQPTVLVHPNGGAGAYIAASGFGG